MIERHAEQLVAIERGKPFLNSFYESKVEGKRRARSNSDVGTLRTFAEARIAGGILIAHSASCGFTSQIETKLAK
jgi:hypothetical protein